MTTTAARPVTPNKPLTTPAEILEAALVRAEVLRASAEAGYVPVRDYVKEAGE